MVASIREKYLNDAQFHSLVDMMASYMKQAHFTPSEMREAAIMASIIYAEYYEPRSILKHIEISKFLDGVDRL